MSMKFFTGLQDFLGLHDSSSSSQQQQQQETASPLEPPESSIPSPTLPSSASSTTSTETENETGLFETSFESSSSEEQSVLQQMEKGDSKDDDELDERKVSRCSHDRSVHFPEAPVTQFYDAPTNSFTEKCLHDTNAINDSYVGACKCLKTEPIRIVQQQIACFHQVPGVRQECLSLKGHRLSSADMECLEEIFNKVQFDTLDFEYTFLDDDSAVCLGEMLEFYDSAIKLNLSFNKQINLRGWQAICKAVKDSPSLQYLNLRYTSLSDRAVPVLARTLRSQPSLTILHLENVSLAGRNLILVVCALKGNTVLRELYLGDNNLQAADGAHIYQLIITNVSIQLLDLRNNQLQDGGLRHICDALRHRDTQKNSALTALVLWNNRITHAGMEALAQALKENGKLETLNIGNNNLSLAGIIALKPALQQNCSLQRMGLQATHLDCQSAIMLAECLADNKVMVRLDLRDNAQIGSAGLLALHLAMKMNTSITLLNLDTSIASSSSSKVKEYQEQFKVYYEEIKVFCERNKQLALKKLSVHTTVQECAITVGENSGGEKKVEGEKLEMNEGVQKKEEKEHERCESIEAEQTSSAPKKNTVWMLSRSASLTCNETVDDIPERVAQMSRSLALIEEVPDSVTTIKKHTVESYPALFTRSELSKSPSLPLLTTENESAVLANPPVTRISRRFSVSTSCLDDANPRDVARARSRFRVERVAPLIQKTTKAKSDGCIATPRSLSESCADDSQEPEFLAETAALLKRDEHVNDRPKKSEAVSNTAVESVTNSENLGSLEDMEKPGNSRPHSDKELEISHNDNKGDQECCAYRDDQEKPKKTAVQMARKTLGNAVIAQKIVEELDFIHGNGSDLHLSTATAASLQRIDGAAASDGNDDTLSTGLWAEISTDFALKRGNSCSTSENVVSIIASKEELTFAEVSLRMMEHQKEYGPKITAMKSFSYTLSPDQQQIADEIVVQEVIRDLVNYVAYEISSSIVLSSSDAFETDEEAVHSVVRGLVRDVLLHEKEMLRRSLRKKRKRLVSMPHFDRHSSG